MPSFEVEVEYTERKTKTLTIRARDSEAAEEKATEIVEGWSDEIEVIDATAEEVG